MLPASDSRILLIGLLAPLIISFALSVYRRREGFRHYLRRVLVSEIVYVISVLYLVQQQHVSPVVALVFGVLTGVAVERLLIKRRSRHIPAAQKKKAIARYERETGRRYNPREDEFDHEIAFARWGSSTADNLRIRPRAENRRKGKKSPWWDMFG